MNFKNLLILLVLLIACSNTYAKYTQTCQVKYETNSGWSKYYTVDVIFMTGFELNQATKTFDYNTYSVYGIIFWDKDEATVIEISTFLACGSEVTKNCITNTIMNLEGEDQKEREWEICVSNFCF